MSGLKTVILKVDMDKKMQQYAINVANQAMKNYNNDGENAVYIQDQFEKEYSLWFSTWHCIVESIATLLST